MSEGGVSVSSVQQKPAVMDTTTVPVGSRDTEPGKGSRHCSSTSITVT